MKKGNVARLVVIFSIPVFNYGLENLETTLKKSLLNFVSVYFSTIQYH